MNLSIIEELVKLAIVALAILLALNLYLRRKLLKQLRESHEEVWKDLGSPSLVKNNSFENGVATLRLIWGPGCRKLNDPALNQLARTERMLHIIQGVVLLLALSLMFSVLLLR
jgi:hypothetical protein